MKIRLSLFWAFFFLSGAQCFAAAEDSWRVSSATTVSSEGLVESVLPPGLVFSPEGSSRFSTRFDDRTSNVRLDFQLLGPDGQPRPFELFWRKEAETVERRLTADKVTMESGGGFNWEASSPEDIRIERISIQMAETGAVGKVDIDALGPAGWVSLAKSAAIFPGKEGMRTEINVVPGVYGRIKVFFGGYDRRFFGTPVPITEVAVSGKPLEKNYATEKIEQAFETVETDEGLEVRTALPGAGLWIESVEITGGVPFIGDWRIGCDEYNAGVEEFRMIDGGTVSEIREDARRFVVGIDRLWPTRTVVLKLKPRSGFPGKVDGLVFFARVPRLVFYADVPGRYTARSGTGERATVLPTPSEPDRRIAHQGIFSEIEVNEAWRPANLVETYGIQGGPFSAEGYRWRGTVKIPGEGFFRLNLNQEASLDGNPSGIRLVRDDIQIPFFWGRPKTASIRLQPEKEYDKKKNRTVWTFGLPRASEHWTELRLASSGIFERNVQMEIPKAGPRSWRPWRNSVWQSLSDKPSFLHIDMKGFPKEETTLRIAMEHGDNRPVELSEVEIRYLEKAAMFVSTAPGQVEVFGGNPDAAAGNYDLDLVRHHLVGLKPAVVEMGDVAQEGKNGWRIDWERMFDEKGWGLYSVLIVISLALIAIIVRLFPKEHGGPERR